ncbi:MAG: cupredoxin family protein [Thiofilum sp.]|nr:cupredoxin family protein [Thiofilum sp.]
MNKEQLTGNIKRYAAASFVVVGAISLGAHQYFTANPWVDDHGGHSHGEVVTQESTTGQESAAHDHSIHDHVAPSAPVVAQASNTSATPSHDHSAHDHSAHDHGTQVSAIGQAGDPAKVERVIHVTMDDTMRYEPSSINVKEGETVLLIVENKGQLKHELTLGDPAFLKEHAAQMLKFPNMEHNDPNMVALEAGAKGEIIWQFTQAGTVDFACLQPGHFEAGMRGAVTVKKDS